LAGRDRILVDVNTLAIFLVEDHPGHSFVAREMEKGLSGHFIPLILDVVPMRAYWIMTRQWDCDPAQSEKALRHFLDAYPIVEYCPVSMRVLHQAFDLGQGTPPRPVRHDVPSRSAGIPGLRDYDHGHRFQTSLPLETSRLCQSRSHKSSGKVRRLENRSRQIHVAFEGSDDKPP